MFPWTDALHRRRVFALLSKKSPFCSKFVLSEGGCVLFLGVTRRYCCTVRNYSLHRLFFAVFFDAGMNLQ